MFRLSFEGIDRRKFVGGELPPTKLAVVLLTCRA